MYTGIQLFGLLKDETDDISLDEVFLKIKEAGYSHIEPCLCAEPIPVPAFKKIIWPFDEFKKNADKIKALGLGIDSVHIFFNNPVQYAKKLAELAKEYGITKYVAKCPRSTEREVLHETAMAYMQTAEILKDAGVELLVHNEAVDVSTKVLGTTAYEYLIDLCQGKVFMQPDLGWVAAGGVEPEKFLWRNQGRVRSLHYKDVKQVNGEFTEVLPGTGEIDLPACFAFGKAFSLTQVVDVDHYSDRKWEEIKEVREFLAGLTNERSHTVSFLNVLNVHTGEVHTLKKFEGVIEAPNWLKTRNELYYNAEGRIYAFDLNTNTETLLDTGSFTNVNNDHVLSPDEKILAVSNMTFDKGFSSWVCSFNLETKEEKLMVKRSPSFLHGWDPKNKEIAYCAFRNMESGKRDVDIYVQRFDEEDEVCLTSGGYNDGPEYSPDGEYIWFNTTRSGLMQVWRMKRDGSEQTQITHFKRNNWFPHVSPNGKEVVFISYGEKDLEAGEHLANFPVELYLMNADGTDQHKICTFFGGQGSINVNSWSGDNEHIAFVSYEIEHE